MELFLLLTFGTLLTLLVFYFLSMIAGIEIKFKELLIDGIVAYILEWLTVGFVLLFNFFVEHYLK